MKIKNTVLLVLGLVLLFCFFQWSRACKDTTGLKEQIALHEETIATLRGMADSINTQLTTVLEANVVLQKGLDDEIIKHKADQAIASKKYKTLTEKITLLETEVQPIIDANPKLAEYVNALKEKIVICEELGLAITAERDAWILKFNAKDVDFRAAIKAKIEMEGALQESLTKYTGCVSDLKKADKKIKSQRFIIKALSVVGVVETVTIAAITVAGVIFK